MKKTVLLVLLISFESHAVTFGSLIFELNGEYRRVNPSVYNAFTGLDTSSPDNFPLINQTETLKWTLDAQAFLGFRSQSLSSQNVAAYFGVYGRYIIPKSVEQNAALDEAGNSPLIKDTVLTGFGGGVMLKFIFRTLFSSSGNGWMPTLDLGLGGGKFLVTQTVDGESFNELQASAYTLEQFGALGLLIPFHLGFNLQLRAGYARQKSTVFEVETTDGPFYETVAAGDRLKTTYPEEADLKLDRTGWVATLGLNTSF